MKTIVNIFLFIVILYSAIISSPWSAYCQEEKTYRDMFVADRPSVSYISFKYLNGFWDVEDWEHIAERPQWGSFQVFARAGFYKDLFAFYGSFEVGEYKRESISGTDNIRVNNDPGASGLRKVSYKTWSEDTREDYHVGLSFNLYKFLERVGMNFEPYIEEEKNEFKNFNLEFFVGYRLLSLRYDRKVDIEDLTIAGFQGFEKDRVYQVVINRLPWSDETDLVEDGGNILHTDVTGVEFGLSGATKSKKGCSIYFRLAYQPALKAKYNGQSNQTLIKHDEEANYWYVKDQQFNAVSGKLWGYQGEFGVRYNMKNLLAKIPADFMKNVNLIATLGYSFDQITGKELWRDQTFHAVTLGLTYAFAHNW